VVQMGIRWLTIPISLQRCKRCSKNASKSKGKMIIEVKTIIVNVNVLHINVIVQEVESQKTRCFRKDNQGRIKILQIGRRINWRKQW
jgi:hypothetical protein